ncbi:sensor histidine kinase YesM [Paenibacillus baekrokdamisoli]|uniref:Sensor histidine kinase YesM n=1 Tax=Paenibacillus baekrokdamisoli TaxID=1712516 RepID=A0A3G9J2W9_9BACL|nr:histidine kinase [Paenibacillus baekrokdamisoli]MBB3067765.1 two-component system sensor histidine kinase YesM [Paenibacillus baekrokdamisoli]BBH19053.1 sensor histidine kinase YesM [Paenibacillus baekrokdamisoli]
MELSRGIAFIKRKVRSRYSLFAKMNFLILILFIPIIIMFTYSNRIALNVISNELQVSNTKQLSFLSSQIGDRINQTMDFMITFSRDPNVQKFNGLNIWDDRYDRMQTRYVIQEKMVLQSGVTNIWPVKYTVYSQQNKEIISNYNNSALYNEDYLKRNMTGKWTYGDGETEPPGESKSFYWFYTESFGQKGMLRGSNLVLEASIGHGNIQNMLDTYKAGGQGDPFFYHKGDTPILNRSASKHLSNELIHYLDKQSLEDTMQQVVRLGNENYLVSAVKSPQLDWYLVDIVPFDQIMGPISFSRNLFYLSMVLLFVFGISASVLLYRNVQRPIRKLIRGLQSVQRGDYSVRINSNVNNEFSFLFYRFNDMSRQIQDLIENVLNEKLRAREATLKQLQAQINPHFLYNCLGYIINMAQMKDEEAVVSMAHNLSSYYRYTTRMERETASLNEEIRLIINYLDIQKLRNGRINYHIDIPEEMLSQHVPRLMLQPIVENAVIHGVGKSYSSGEIRISGEVSDGCCRIYIDDDGPGMNPELQEVLNRKMRVPLQEEMGCGLWNTNQRIIHLFGDNSSLYFTKSLLGGFRTEIIWEIPAKEEHHHSTLQGDELHADDHS